MLQKVRLEKWNKIYTIFKIQNLELDNLAMFFTGDLRIYDDLSWVMDTEFEGLSFNETVIFIDIDNDRDTLIIKTQYFDDVLPRFRIKREKLLRLCKAWLKIYPQYPEFIDLTQEGNKFTFEYDTLEGHQTIVIE